MIVRTMAEAMARSGVGHVVFLSSMGGHLASGTGPVRLLHEAEGALAATGRPLADPAVVVPARATGPRRSAPWPRRASFPRFIPLDQRMEMNGTVDLGREAARRLVEPPPVSRRVLEMGGPHPTTPLGDRPRPCRC